MGDGGDEIHLQFVELLRAKTRDCKKRNVKRQKQKQKSAHSEVFLSDSINHIL